MRRSNDDDDLVPSPEWLCSLSLPRIISSISFSMRALFGSMPFLDISNNNACREERSVDDETLGSNWQPSSEVEGVVAFSFPWKTMLSVE